VTSGVINAAALTVTANSCSRACGLPNPSLSASYSGFASGEDTNVLTSPAILSTTATNSSAPGLYPITASGAAAANYTINYVAGTLTVLLPPQLSCSTVNLNGTNQFLVSWLTIAGESYQLETTANLATGTWTPLGNSIAGTGDLVTVTNSMAASPQCFYRAMVQ
jgi:hypothetical protein